MKEAYVAGIIDGEGTITLSRQRANEFRCPVVSVSSTTYEIMDYLKTHYGGFIVKHKTYKDHHKQSWSWKVERTAAFKILADIQHYLLVPEKRHRCALILNTYKSVTPRNGKYTPDLIKQKQEFEYLFFHPSTP